jgi:hypothetical protein
MSTKKRASKLDQYATVLAEMEAAGKTLVDMQAWLKQEGCTAALGSISAFLSHQRSQRLQSSLLQQIASGAQQCKEVEKQFGSNPAPEVDTLIKLHRVLILNLTTQGNANPELLDQVNALMKPVLDFAKLNLKREELDLSKEKFEHLKAMADKGERTDKVLSDAELTPEQRAQRIKEIYGRA